jgi:hypothetical protein
MTWTLPWTNRVKAMQYLVATLGAGHSPGTSIGYRTASAVLVGRFRAVHDTGGGHRLATRPCRLPITLKLQPPAEATLCFILLRTTVTPAHHSRSLWTGSSRPLTRGPRIDRAFLHLRCEDFDTRSIPLFITPQHSPVTALSRAFTFSLSHLPCPTSLIVFTGAPE